MIMPILGHTYDNYTEYGREYDDFFLKPKKWIQARKAKRAAKKKGKTIMQQMGSETPIPKITPKPIAPIKPKVVKMVVEKLPTKPKVTTNVKEGMTTIGEAKATQSNKPEVSKGNLKAGLTVGIIIAGTLALVMTYTYIKANTPQPIIATA